LPPNGRTELCEVPEQRPNGDLVPVVSMAFADWQLRAKSRDSAPQHNPHANDRFYRKTGHEARFI